MTMLDTFLDMALGPPVDDGAKMIDEMNETTLPVDLINRLNEQLHRYDFPALFPDHSMLGIAALLYNADGLATIDQEAAIKAALTSSLKRLGGE